MHFALFKFNNDTIEPLKQKSLVSITNTLSQSYSFVKLFEISFFFSYHLFKFQSINLQGNDEIEVKCQRYFYRCIVALLHLPLQEKEETAVTIKYLLVISTFLCNHGIFA